MKPSFTPEQRANFARRLVGGETDMEVLFNALGLRGTDDVAPFITIALMQITRHLGALKPGDVVDACACLSAEMAAQLGVRDEFLAASLDKLAEIRGNRKESQS